MELREGLVEMFPDIEPIPFPTPSIASQVTGFGHAELETMRMELQAWLRALLFNTDVRFATKKNTSTHKT